MYKVIKNFRDLQDGNHRYLVGDIFPRAGVKVTLARIKELASKENKTRMPLIEEVEPKKVIEEKPKKVEKKEVKEVKTRKKTTKKGK